MAMATKMVMVTATRVGEVVRRRNGYEGVHGGGGRRTRTMAAQHRRPHLTPPPRRINKSHLLLNSD
jgi:hypothetical protein